jgi:hypothetical protein
VSRALGTSGMELQRIYEYEFNDMDNFMMHLELLLGCVVSLSFA